MSRSLSLGACKLLLHDLKGHAHTLTSLDISDNKVNFDLGALAGFPHLTTLRAVKCVGLKGKVDSLASLPLQVSSTKQNNVNIKL